MDTTKISFSVDSTDPLIPLGFDAWLDDHCFFSTDHVNKKLDIVHDLPDDEADHVLKFVMRGKQEQHTSIVDTPEGKKTKDVLLTVSDLAGLVRVATVDQHNLRHLTSDGVQVFGEENTEKLKALVSNLAAYSTAVLDKQAVEIVNDIGIKISDLTFAEIKLGHTFLENAVYHHDFNGSQAPVQDAFYGEMGCNGHVELKFTAPIYLWLLEKM
jgi:hypothetical protein